MITMEDKVRVAAIKYIRLQQHLTIIGVTENGWLIAIDQNEYDELECDELTTIFIKVIYDHGRFKPYNHDKLRLEFEDEAAKWITTEGFDSFGVVRGDVVDLNILGDDRALLRYEKNAVGMR